MPEHFNTSLGRLVARIIVMEEMQKIGVGYAYTTVVLSELRIKSYKSAEDFQEQVREHCRRYVREHAWILGPGGE